MANYCCSTRTNYFRVKDPEAFRKFMDDVVISEDSLAVWEEERDGVTVFGFGGYGSILGVAVYDSEEDRQNGYWDDYDYEEFVIGLSEHVAEDDAVIILESGNEKLRYVVGSALVVTSKGSRYMEINDLAVDAAREMLDNSQWDTKLAY